MHTCVVAHLSPARFGTFVREHVRGLVRRGYRVTVIAGEAAPAMSVDELAALDRRGITRSGSARQWSRPPVMRGAVEAALSHFTLHRDDVLRFGLQARRFVEQAFSLVTMVDPFEDLYASTMSAASVPESSTVVR